MPSCFTYFILSCPEQHHFIGPALHRRPSPSLLTEAPTLPGVSSLPRPLLVPCLWCLLFITRSLRNLWRNPETISLRSSVCRNHTAQTHQDPLCLCWPGTKCAGGQHHMAPSGDGGPPGVASQWDEDSLVGAYFSSVFTFKLQRPLRCCQVLGTSARWWAPRRKTSARIRRHAAVGCGTLLLRC